MAQYVVYKNKIKENISRLKKAFLNKGLEFQLFYSVKTNFSEAVLRAVKEAGGEYEIVSYFEWRLVKKFKPKSLVLNGPAKSLKFIKEILKNTSMLYLNIDNDTDFDIVRGLTKKEFGKTKIGLRVYFPETGIWNRFGYNIFDRNIEEKIKLIGSFSKLAGIHFHFSTNNFYFDNYKSLLTKVKELLDKSQLNLEFLNIGGGLPAANEFVFWTDVYKRLPCLIAELFPQIKIISEAGRNIVADAVDLETNVISFKKTGNNRFDVAVDTNIMHFQCFFEKKFWVEYIPLQKKKGNLTEVTIFGNSCMQIDEIAKNILINQIPSVGDRVIIHNIGAYSFSQAANFISEIPRVKAYEENSHSHRFKSC